MADVVLVTGCSSGFGLLTALRFQEEGDTVVATMRDPSKADERLDEVVPLDVTSDASVAEAVGRVLESHGRIDVLVNNAGVGIHGAVEDVTVEEAKAVFETNVWGVHRMVHAVLPVMRQQGSGVIVNVSSVAGIVAAPFGGVYAMSKWALEAMSEALHYELSPTGVRVAVIEPGGFPTAFDANRKVADKPDSPYAGLEARWEEASERLPGRDEPADPADVAAAIVVAARDRGHPLRRLVGADAELIGSLRKQLDDATFEHTIRTSLDFWEGAVASDGT
jgi:NAD(P)-dependent dehydrogenase (short-subunit alcohol dehydrogenase family)